jgi:hypothetical protein
MSAEKTVYVINSVISHVEEKHETVSGRTIKSTEVGIPDSTHIETQSLGWFIRVEGMLFAIGLGEEKPVCKVGDTVRIGIEVSPSK